MAIDRRNSKKRRKQIILDGPFVLKCESDGGNERVTNSDNNEDDLTQAQQECLDVLSELVAQIIFEELQGEDHEDD